MIVGLRAADPEKPRPAVHDGQHGNACLPECSINITVNRQGRPPHVRWGGEEPASFLLVRDSLGRCEMT